MLSNLIDIDNLVGLVCANLAALICTRFPRRRMFLLCTISMLVVFIGWTVSMQRVLAATAHSGKNSAASIAVLFFIFAYTPAYNIGNNALVYSKSSYPSVLCKSLGSLTQVQHTLSSSSLMPSALEALLGSNSLAEVQAFLAHTSIQSLSKPSLGSTWPFTADGLLSRFASCICFTRRPTDVL